MKWKTLREIWWRPLDNAVSVPRPMVSASGLIYSDDGLWAVGDDLHHLIRIPFGNEVSEGHRLFPGDLPEDFKARKKTKPDTEALFEISFRGEQRVWIAMPSGSKRHRVKGAVIFKGAELKIREVDFTTLFAAFKEQIPELNIEGGAVVGEELVLFQRGNGKGRANALVSLGREDFVRGLESGWSLKAIDFQVRLVDLGQWNDVPLTFTDGFSHNGKLYFAAAAEDTESTYEDGGVVGSVIGVWDGAFSELARIEKHKVEGIAIDPVKGLQGGLFAVTDADETLSPSLLLKLILDIPQAKPL